MGYQALLFCPDEKTARTVTQVLSELEFNVESCIEPFAAVKKLMGQHFDAVVVDCDNEQNATLLFKSARNSTSNQASLAVAVVEGQAGVAKAFRIGANLVLTKPINIEQAKGTLRVARGLLRKGEPLKPAGTAAAVSPAKPIAAKSVPSAKPAAPTTVATARSAAPPEVTPTPAWPATAAVAASSIPAVHSPAVSDDDLLEIWDDSISAPSGGASPESAFYNLARSDSQAAKLPAAEGKTAFHAGSPAMHGSGAASAPATAREIQDSHAVEISPPGTSADTSAEAAHGESSSYAGAEPSFTFGGANVPAESSGATKKVLVGVAAAALVVGALYFGWTKFQGHKSQPVSTQTPALPAPVAVPQSGKPGGAKAAPAIFAPTPATSTSLPSSQRDGVSAKTQAADDTDFASDDASVPSSTKPSSSTSPAAGKTAPAPLVVKGGTTPGMHSKTAPADAPAPSMVGIATAGAPPPDLVSAGGSAPQPVLQAMNVSQGVSQGLLVKKVQPTYPKNALFMHIEGAVELVATISKTGDISRVKVLNGDSQLTRAATDAVKQWKYKPYLLNGEPVEIQTQVTINFKLPK
jgi:TonB family protein